MNELKVGIAVYTGKLKQNKPHGEGKLHVDDQEYTGIWEEGRLDDVETLNEKAAKQVEKGEMETISVLVDETRVYIGEVDGVQPQG